MRVSDKAGGSVIKTLLLKPGPVSLAVMSNQGLGGSHLETCFLSMTSGLVPYTIYILSLTVHHLYWLLLEV